jgi:hypothetical protein
LARDFNNFNVRDWRFPNDAPKDEFGNLLLFKDLKDENGNPLTPEKKSFRALFVELFSLERY